MSAQEIIETFALLPDWEDRYAYLIELGDHLPPFDEQDKTEQNKVLGCMSNVWLTVRKQAGGYDIRATSDAAIVRGLIAVVLSVVQGADKETILKTNITELFTQLGLSEHLSPNRQNGFFAMWKTIQARVSADVPDKKQSGRTLVEMMAVVAIGGLLIAGALAGFSEVNLRRKVNQVYGELQERASAAVSRITRSGCPGGGGGWHAVPIAFKEPTSGAEYNILCRRNQIRIHLVRGVGPDVIRRLVDMDYSRIEGAFAVQGAPPPLGILSINANDFH